MERLAHSRLAKVAVLLTAVALSAVPFIGARASWTSPDCRFVVTYFYLPAGEYLNAYVCQDFETTSLLAGVLTDVYSSNSSVPEMYAQVDGFDTCYGMAYVLYAYADKTAYNTNTFQTDHAVGMYRNCGDRHGYKNYGEAWGQDPPPDWHIAYGAWCDNTYVPCT